MQNQDTLDVTQGVTQDMERSEADPPVVGIIMPQPAQGTNEGIIPEPLNATTYQSWTEDTQDMARSDVDPPVVVAGPLCTFWPKRVFFRMKCQILWELRNNSPVEV